MAWEHCYCGTVYDQRKPPLDCEFCRGLLTRVTKGREQGWRQVTGPLPTTAVRASRGPVGRNKRERIYKRDNYTCVACGRKPPRSELSIDHKIPRSRGGTNRDDNLQTMCKPCNVKKGNKLPGDVSFQRD